MGKENKDQDQDKKKSNILKIIMVVVFLAAIIGTSYVVWTKVMGGTTSINLTGEKKVKTVNLELEEILVKLSDGKYIKTNIVIAHDKDIKDINDYVPQIRDGIIKYLMSSDADDFSSDNIEGVKKDMIKILNNKIDKEGIYNIYFTDLIIQ